jgi:hypothetical protein
MEESIEHSAWSILKGSSLRLTLADSISLPNSVKKGDVGIVDFRFQIADFIKHGKKRDAPQ